MVDEITRNTRTIQNDRGVEFRRDINVTLTCSTVV